MKRQLVDVNVWIALAVQDHSHHSRAIRWFDSLGTDQALLCRVVQLSFVRLSSDPRTVGPDALSPRKAWDLVETLMADERVAFAKEPADWAQVFPRLLRHPRPSPKLVADAYLAAFALVAGYRVATFDAGFTQFPGIDLVNL